ncbi:MAG: hypothetical protein V9G12_11980 [Microthrixaceae bacterium]
MTITEIAIKRPSLIIVIFGVLLLGGVVGPRRTAPWAAMAIASVAPEQKTTSRGRAPRARATRSRACSTP